MTTRLSYTDYYLTIRRAKNSEWQREWESVLAYYTTLNLTFNRGKVSTAVLGSIRSSMLYIGHIRLAHSHFMSGNDQHSTCRNTACRNQRLSIKHVPNGGETADKNTIFRAI